jgi:hypothetical protein
MKAIQISGKPGQISAAKELMQHSVNKGNAMTTRRQKISWAKITAHSVAKEADLDRQDINNLILQQLRKAPDPSVKLPQRVRPSSSQIRQKALVLTFSHS